MVNQNSITTNDKHFNISLYLYTPISFFVALLCFVNCQRDEFAGFWILPFAFSILSILTFENDKKLNGLSYHIIKIIMFLRYVIMTLATVTTQYYEGVALSVESYTPTLILMLYEMIVVFVVMTICAKRRPVNDNYLNSNEVQTEGALLKLFYIFIIIVTAFVILTYPQARNTLFNFSFAMAEDKMLDVSEDITGPAFVFFKIGINVSYALIMMSIKMFSKRRGNFAFLLGVLVSIVFISCNWTGGGNVSRWGLVTSTMVSYVVLVKMFPQNKKVLKIVGGTAFAYIILLSSVTKVMLHHANTTEAAVDDIFTIEYFSEYFHGIYPVTNGLKIMDIKAEDINFVTLLDDTFSAYPWLNKLFYEAGNSTNVMYLRYLGLNDKILPTICQGYAHFGYLGAPIFSGFLTYIALKCDFAIKRNDSIVSLVALTQIGVWSSLYMAVNMFIIQRTTMYFVLLWLVIKIDKAVSGGKR